MFDHLLCHCNRTYNAGVFSHLMAVFGQFRTTGGEWLRLPNPQPGKRPLDSKQLTRYALWCCFRYI